MADARQETFNNRGFGQAFNGQGQSPQYGFTNSYQPSPQAQALGAVLNALQDPRNQWMGTGMVGGTIRGLGGLRNFFADKAAAKAGGFQPTLKDLMKHPEYKPMTNVTTDELLASDMGTRARHLKDVESMNMQSKWIESDNPILSKRASEELTRSSPSFEEGVNRTFVGRRQLQDLNQRAFTQTEGPPPEMIQRLFGLKE